MFEFLNSLSPDAKSFLTFCAIVGATLVGVEFAAALHAFGGRRRG